VLHPQVNFEEHKAYPKWTKDKNSGAILVQGGQLSFWLWVECIFFTPRSLFFNVFKAYGYFSMALECL